MSVNRPRPLFVWVAIMLGFVMLISLATTENLKGRMKVIVPGIKGQFNGQRAWLDVQYQVSLGARIPGSQAHAETASWIQQTLRESGWQTDVQVSEAMGHPIYNVIGRLGEGTPWVILGAHYDSRLVADHDVDLSRRTLAVPGANDGASGVAVLLEIARVIDERSTNPDSGWQPWPGQIWLVFFDAEDNGSVAGWDWILGSRSFVEQLNGKPDAVVIVDMIGDADLNIYLEKNSDVALARQIWSQAQALGYQENFVPMYRYRILDDHIPFLEAGIPAVDIIDFDYPYWHTTADTLDKVSAQSLQIVGETLMAWLSK